MDLSDAIDRTPLLQELEPADRQRLERGARVRELRRGGVAWESDERCETLAFVVRGHLKLERYAEDGRRVIVDVLGPGRVACGSKPVVGGCYCCSAIAVERGTQVLTVPRANVEALLDESPHFAASVLRSFARDTQRRCGRIEEQAAGSVEQRVARLLTRLVDTEGESLNGEGTLVRLDIQRQDLASLCGTTIETAIRTLSKLRARGLVREINGGFVVPDREALTAVARGH